MDRKSGKSFTQLEYERAVELNKHRLVYIADDKTAVFPATAFEKDTRRQSKLKAFKSTLRDQQVIQTFSTADDLAEKIQRDIQRDFPVESPQPSEDLQTEFDLSLKTIRDFSLTPKRLNGTEVRLSIAVPGSPFPASRLLCEKFNLEYGSTIGTFVTIRQPSDGKVTKGLRELYASGKRVDLFQRLRAEKRTEIYASLLFSEADIATSRAEFFGYSFNPQEEYDPSDDDGSVYIPPQGKVILLFTKLA